MRRVVITLVSVVVVMCVVVAVGIWLLVRDQPRSLPQISAYSNGHLVRVGPYQYCKVLNLNECQSPHDVGELPVTDRLPVQLSVPSSISRGLWQARRVYQDSTESVDEFRPGTMAATVPTVDGKHGRLAGIAVQLFTLVRGTGDQLFKAPHAEWSIRMVWS